MNFLISKRLDEKIVEEQNITAEEASRQLGLKNISQIEVNDIIEALYEVHA